MEFDICIKLSYKSVCTMCNVNFIAKLFRVAF